MSFCSNCGNGLAEGARICSVCGHPVDDQPKEQAPKPQPVILPEQAQESPQQASAPPPQAFPVQSGVPAQRQTDSQAIASLVCGILGILFCPIILSIVALVLGNQSKKRIAESGGTLDGEGMAKAGTILGIIGIIWGALQVIFLIIFFGAIMAGTAGGSRFGF